jgi:IS5 family transposase
MTLEIVEIEKHVAHLNDSWTGRSGLVIHMAPADALRYKTRTVAEHTNGRLKEEFGGRHVMVRGYEKVKLHLMFGIIALFADQLLRLA